MAFLNEAFRGMSPYQDTKVYAPKDLQEDQTTSINTQKNNVLKSTVEDIKNFFWNRFHTVGVDDRGSMPPF